MTTIRSSQTATQDRSAEVWGMTDLPAQFLTAERPPVRRDRAMRPLAALIGRTLDRRLASGDSLGSGRLLAARAGHLASARARRELVRDWQRVLDQALRAPRPRNPHVPLCRDRIFDAAGAMRAMLDALSTPVPVSARGVAMARLLLSDGTGPLYNRKSPVDLSAALREVTARLDPGVFPAG
jgi:hypothetical protein